MSEQPLDVLLDPRSDVALAALEEQAALQRDVYAALAQGTDATAAADAAIAKLAAAPQAAAQKSHAGQGFGPRGSVTAMRPVRDALAKAASNLNSLAVDLESADGPPTGPQKSLYESSRKALDEAQARWKTVAPKA